MSAAVLQLRKAQLEIIDAWTWYEDNQPGLGDRFLIELQEKINLITGKPLLYQKKGNYREARLEIFPYLIVFKFIKKKDLILIVSVFHSSRHPNKK